MMSGQKRYANLLVAAAVLVGLAAAASSDTREHPIVRTVAHKPAVPKHRPLTAQQEQAARAGLRFKECDAGCPEMVVVPAGTFQLGSPPSEPQRESWQPGTESPQVEVKVARPFAVGAFAVTFEQWDACVADQGCNGHVPSDQGWGRGRRPVVNVTLDDALAFATWVSSKTGKPYRLLSEAEREYVARAGTETPFWWGEAITPLKANYNGKYEYLGGGVKGMHRARTVAVDSFEPNPWGVYQVHGNIWELTADCWNDSHEGHPGDTSARTSGDCERRVIKGGSWGNFPWTLRSASRSFEVPTARHGGLGFRLARSLGQ